MLFRSASRLAAYLHARDSGSTASIDAATGLYDVQGLAHFARELGRRAYHHRAPLACIALSPDVAGEREGLDAAEQLRVVAEVLVAHGRRSDALGRLGASEFAVIAPGTDAEGAVGLVQRMTRALQGAAANTGLSLSLRAGYDAVANVRYAPFAPEHLLARAVQALRKARISGEWIAVAE